MSYGSTGRANRLTPPSQCQRTEYEEQGSEVPNAPYADLCFRRGSLSEFRFLHSVPGILIGGASRDRTGDLKLAKLALSQLSYGPDPESRDQDRGSEYLIPDTCRLASGWWARDELNVRPHAYQACALTT